ncbi:sulfatase-like hydrolase/transferase [Haloferula sp. BvORR071]|uniref:sulfatase-like hydrolase/transferase n=1 Tax=Haloferula sp. BvORR071 TaxID=1396141 RepID=UPI000695D239|nr:sulfatase-like hydrolase/transferase [Haloferula sp. BvORR071]
MLLALFAGSAQAQSLVLDFQFNQNADLESGTNGGADDMGSTTATRSNIGVGDGTFLNFTVAAAPGNLNSADNGIGVQGGTGVARMGPGESATFKFNRKVIVNGYTLNEVTGTDDSTFLTPTSGGVQTRTTAAVTGLSLPLEIGQTLVLSSTVGDGIRIATLTLTVPSASDDKFQVLHDSSANPLEVLRNDASGVSLVSLTQPAHGSAAIDGSRILYTPLAGYVGPDSFTYTSSAATWTVTMDVRRYPNFVMIYADDQGWTGTSVRMDKDRADSKSDYYRTPNLELLASQGMRFSRGYSPHPNCSPSRYGILTGRTLARLKMTDIVGRSGSELSGKYKLITPGKAVNAIQAAERTTPELLKAIPGSGYSAAHFGKWHLAGDGPASHGFDADANDGATGNEDGNTGSAPINADAKRAYSITNRAMDFLDSRVNSGSPFYLQVSHYAVHESIQTTQASFDSYASVPVGTNHTNRNYAGMTTDLDINVGRLLDRLEGLGIRNSTYVIYQADNGAPQDMSQNDPLRGYKPELWEGGIRVPTFVRGPGVPADSQCKQAVSGIDWMPTILDWASGGTATLPAPTDGGSLAPVIHSIAQNEAVQPVVARGGEMVIHSPHYIGPLPWPDDWKDTPKDMRPRSAILSGNYKLVANYEKGSLELYDLNNEIGELTNLSEAQLAIKWQLWVRLRDYLKGVNAQMPTLDPSYQGTSVGDFVLPAATGPLGDADSDGLSDAWEFRELLTYAFDGNGDMDQDGVSNAQELAQGTDPLLPNALAITSLAHPSPDQLQMTWNATPGAQFVIESSTDLTNWAAVQTITAGDSHLGNATVACSGPQQFFRVRLP